MLIRTIAIGLFLLAAPVLADGGTVRPTGKVEPRKAPRRFAPIKQPGAKAGARTPPQQRKDASGVTNRTINP